MIKILVVDDEPIPRDALARKLSELRTDLEIHAAADGWAALDEIKAWRPAVVFLDIAMPGLTGIELLGQIGADDRNFALVFCTAHAEHALKAFELQAVDYLLKPVDPARLEAALERALAPSAPWSERLAEPRLTRIAARTRKGTVVVDAASIVHFASEAHETVAYTEGGQELVLTLSLSDLEARLDPARFLRCHRSHIVSLPHVREILDDAMVAVLADGRQVPVARRKKSELIAALR